MADKNLRKRLAHAAGLALSDEILDTIYSRLMNIEEGKIPLTIKYDFTVSKEGVMEVKVTSACNLALEKFSLSLLSDGDQLSLPVEVLEKEVPSEVSAAEVGEGLSSAQKRMMEQINKNNERLYQEGVISKDQAIEAGLVPSSSSKMETAELTDEEVLALEEIANRR